MPRRLLEQRARAFNYLFDAVVVTDLAGTIIDWNAGAERLYGYERSEVLGKPVSMLHAPEDVEERIREVIGTVKRDEIWSGEIKMVRKDGTIGWTEVVVVPVTNDDGETIGALGVNRDITERVQSEEELARLAHYDPITGLANRSLLLDRLDRMLLHVRRTKESFAVLFIDLDGFKRINDNAGHRVGDQVLKEAAQRMERSLRESDTVSRLGGDEFVVLVDRVGVPEDAGRVARKLLGTLREPVEVAGRKHRLSGSIGIAIYPFHGTTADDLLTYADDAMYRAKRRGKDNFQY